MLIFACSPLLRAQTGCGDSPEPPTLVLALVGSAGALATAVRGRFRARR
ncbi:MAG: PExPT-CTERM protein [Terracidiphilus sp.]